MLTRGDLGLVVDMTIAGAMPASHATDGSPGVASVAAVLGIPLVTTRGALRAAVGIFRDLETGFPTLEPLPHPKRETANSHQP